MRIIVNLPARYFSYVSERLDVTATITYVGRRGITCCDESDGTLFPILYTDTRVFPQITGEFRDTYPELFI